MRRIQSIAAIVLLAGAMTLGLKVAHAQTPQYGGHLRVAYDLTPTSLDPAVGRSGGDAYYWRQLFDPLVDADSQLVPRPETSLAQSWEFPNPTTMVFHLRRGVKFHDGTAFNAQAVKFNIDRVLDEKVGATPRASLRAIKSVEVVDAYTVRFHLNAPWGAGLGMLADRGGTMGSPAAIAKLGQEYGFKSVGTGPFKLAEVISGSSVHMVRNPDYWGKDAQGRRLPYLDEVTIKIIRDQNVITAGLKTGEIDLAYVQYKDIDAFEHDPGYKTIGYPGSGIAYLLAFNLKKPPLDNVYLRLAIASAVNPESINKAVYADKAIIAKAGMWPVRTWVYDDTVPRSYYDPQKAREYLKLGGKADGFTVDAVTWTNDYHVPSAEIVKAQLAEVGITLNIQMLSVGAATSQFFELPQSPPLFLTSWSRYPEPDWIASLSYKSDGYYNPMKLPRPDMDQLIEAGARTYDLKERKKIYRKVNEIVLGEAWYVPLLYAVGTAAAPAKVQGLDTLFGWDAKWDLRRIWIKP